MRSLVSLQMRWHRQGARRGTMLMPSLPMLRMPVRRHYVKCCTCDAKVHNRCSSLDCDTVRQINEGRELFTCQECDGYSSHLTMPMLRLIGYFEPPRERRNDARERINHIISQTDDFATLRRSRHFKISSGLRSKLDDVRIHAELYNPDVILIQESKLHQSIKNSELQVPGYSLFRKDRTANGGGVCIYAKEDKLIIIITLC